MFETPIIKSPNSSGKGDAIIKAPKKGKSHLKILNLKIETNLSFFDFFNKYKISSFKRSLANLKITKSPKTAPKPPKKAAGKSELNLTASIKNAVAGAVVKIEVKNTPAIKLPKNFKFCAVCSKF